MFNRYHNIIDMFAIRLLVFSVVSIAAIMVLEVIRTYFEFVALSDLVIVICGNMIGIITATRKRIQKINKSIHIFLNLSRWSIVVFLWNIFNRYIGIFDFYRVFEFSESFYWLNINVLFLYFVFARAFVFAF